MRLFNIVGFIGRLLGIGQFQQASAATKSTTAPAPVPAPKPSRKMGRATFCVASERGLPKTYAFDCWTKSEGRAMLKRELGLKTTRDRVFHSTFRKPEAKAARV